MANLHSDHENRLTEGAPRGGGSEGGNPRAGERGDVRPRTAALLATGFLVGAIAIGTMSFALTPADPPPVQPIELRGPDRSGDRDRTGERRDDRAERRRRESRERPQGRGGARRTSPAQPKARRQPPAQATPPASTPRTGPPATRPSPTPGRPSQPAPEPQPQPQPPPQPAPPPPPPPADEDDPDEGVDPDGET